MDGWPDDWFRNDSPGSPGAGRRGPGSAERGTPGEPTRQIPHPEAASQAAAGRAAGGTGAWPDQGAPPGPDWPDQPSRASRVRNPGGRRRGHRVLKIIAVLVAVVLVGAIGMYFYLDSKLNRVAALADYPGRPTASAGQNWLITGSDSRQGLTRQQETQLATGHDVTGQRSDTIMLLHIPGNGGAPTLVSLPRDLYVAIPGNGMNKMNAAFALGGAKLLAETVQNYTGLRVDHYMEIGFGGLVNVVDSVGGVNICVKHALDDPASGLHLKAGCQTLNGGQALGYVRDRHSFGASDLQRVQDQRAFLKALLSKATSPAVFLNPFTAIPTATSSAGALTVDQGTHLYQLAHVAFALRGPQTTTVPLAGSETTAVGDVLLTDRTNALQLFNALGSDQPIPKSLLTGTSGA
jgi:LCP family protein required for cell wall assembly